MEPRHRTSEQDVGAHRLQTRLTVGVDHESIATAEVEDRRRRRERMIKFAQNLPMQADIRLVLIGGGDHRLGVSLRMAGYSASGCPGPSFVAGKRLIFAGRPYAPHLEPQLAHPLQ